MAERKCNYCNTLLTKFTKDDTTGKWSKFEGDGTLHTYNRCKAVQALNKLDNAADTKVPEGQSRLPQQSNPVVASSPSGFVDKSSATNAVIFRLEKIVNENKKMLETQASIIDSMAQKIELLIQKVGYPEPLPAEGVVSKTIKEVVDNYGTETINTTADGEPILVTPEQQKAFDNTQEEAKKAILENKDMQPKNWTEISESFECHGCDTQKHNGYEKYGTKLCEDCYSEINQTKPRTIEEINSDDIL